MTTDPSTPSQRASSPPGVDRVAVICMVAIVAMTFFVLVWATTLVAD